MSGILNEDFHEVWWIYSPERHEWGGLRIAHFRKTVNGTLIAIMLGEADPHRIGPRIWDDVATREGWVKVKPIALPDAADVDAAIDAAMRGIVRDLKEQAGFDPS